MHIPFTATAALLLTSLSLPTLTTAGGCPPKKLGIPIPVCGRVENKTRWKLKWAEYSTGSDKCHVYNWNGGDGAVGWSPAGGQRGVQCDQNFLDAHESKGGYTHDRVDVDGVTFADRRWRVIWENGHSDDLAAGVWVKFSNGETAYCTENADGRVPECRIKCETDVPGFCVG